MPHLTIVTGASRGLGHAMAAQLLASGHRLLTLQRHPDAGLAAGARSAALLEQWPIDLADAPAAAQRLQDWLAALNPADLQSATLINNAAVVSDLVPLGQGGLASLGTAVRVGLEAPLLLTAAFLHATTHWRMPRKVLNISSGLGRRAMAGSASYCAVKAGIDHFSRAVALEQAGLPNGARIVALAPGVIDTDMQVQLRGASPAGLPEREMFVNLHARGQLASPLSAATQCLKFLNRPDFGANPIGDVRDV